MVLKLRVHGLQGEMGGWVGYDSVSGFEANEQMMAISRRCSRTSWAAGRFLAGSCFEKCPEETARSDLFRADACFDVTCAM